ncbi:MAG: cysteine desulfurase family protein [Candidatus Spechtbacterales bacterium]
MNKQGIYLDYAATTPVSEAVFKEMQPYFGDVFANPSALHTMGQEAQAALDNARHEIADILGADWREIIFTASATESINLAIRGVVKDAKRSLENPHIVTTSIEHSAVLETCRDLEKEGVEVSYIPVDGDGLVNPDDVAKAIKDTTVLASVMYVNNEIGTIQPIKQISDLINSYNENSDVKKVVFHTDAVQATNYLDINPHDLGVDLMTISGHKIYGPKGTAILFKSRDVSLAPATTGGGQERGYRSGTENIPAIVGFAKALKDAQSFKNSESERLTALRDKFIKDVLSGAKGAGLNGSAEKRIANNASFCFENFPSEVMVPALDAKGVYVSSGSACAARVPEPSHVINAIGKEDCALNTIRCTLGRETTEEDLKKATEAIIEISNQA